MKAVILCAGQGSRLLPLTQSVPKCLVPVAGKPLLSYQLAVLEGAVDEVILVTGYLHRALEDFAGGRGTLVHNETYASTNSIYSLWLAREHVEGQDFVLLNGDLLYDAETLAQLLSASAPTALLVDERRELVEGEMNVVVRERLVVEIGKDIPLSRANAQSLQIVKFAGRDSQLLFEQIGRLVSEGDTNRFPPYAYPAIFRRSAMAAVQLDRGTWFEIDTVDDLARCEEILALRAGTGR